MCSLSWAQTFVYISQFIYISNPFNLVSQIYSLKQIKVEQWTSFEYILSIMQVSPRRSGNYKNGTSGTEVWGKHSSQFMKNSEESVSNQLLCTFSCGQNPLFLMKINMITISNFKPGVSSFQMSFLCFVIPKPSSPKFLSVPTAGKCISWPSGGCVTMGSTKEVTINL